jgi:hypothetical protein
MAFHALLSCVIVVPCSVLQLPQYQLEVPLAEHLNACVQPCQESYTEHSCHRWRWHIAAMNPDTMPVGVDEPERLLIKASVDGDLLLFGRLSGEFPGTDHAARAPGSQQFTCFPH